MSLKSSNDDEAVDTGTRDSALAFSGYIGKHVTSPSLYRLVVTFAQRFYYSAYPVLACYWHFPLLDISNDRHYLHFYSSKPLPDISITRRFSITT